MRIALSVFFIVHGIAHLTGLLVPWQLAPSAEMPYTTKVLGGTADLGPVGIGMVSILWLLAAVAFVVAGPDGARLAPVSNRFGAQPPAPGISHLGSKAGVAPPAGRVGIAENR